MLPRAIAVGLLLTLLAIQPASAQSVTLDEFCDGFESSGFAVSYAARVSGAAPGTTLWLRIDDGGPVVDLSDTVSASGTVYFTTNMNGGPPYDILFAEDTDFNIVIHTYMYDPQNDETCLEQDVEPTPTPTPSPSASPSPSATPTPSPTPIPTPPSPTPPLPGECEDGIDNDGDGAIDNEDPDCVVGDSESPATPTPTATPTPIIGQPSNTPTPTPSLDPGSSGTPAPSASASPTQVLPSGSQVDCAVDPKHPACVAGTTSTGGGTPTPVPLTNEDLAPLAYGLAGAAGIGLIVAFGLAITAGSGATAGVAGGAGTAAAAAKAEAARQILERSACSTAWAGLSATEAKLRTTRASIAAMERSGAAKELVALKRREYERLDKRHGQLEKALLACLDANGIQAEVLETARYSAEDRVMDARRGRKK